MALRGTLKEFRIADIFQLVSQQAKTGTLRFKSKGKTVWVSFHEGWIVRVEDSRKSSQETICEMLLKAELVQQEDLDIALDVHKTTGRSLGEVLSLRKLLAEEKFHQLVFLQMREALYELFMWDSGRYEFDANSVLSEGTWGRLNTESILMDGFRVVDEWPEVRKKIPDEDVFIEKIMPFPESTQEPKIQRPSRNMLGLPERLIYQLAKVGFPIKKVIDLSCLGRFDGLRAFINLVDQGCIQLSSPLSHGSEPSSKTRRRWMRMGGQIGIAFFYLIIVSVIGASNNWYMLEFGDKRDFFSTPVIQQHIARAQMARIEAAIEIYRLEHSTVPKKLEDLVEERLLNADDLRHPWHTAYHYSRESSDDYRLSSPSE
ncbi:MAG: DUF4388 domain-containing protein [Cystobacterineae bacterium]|nr:DUF4388 domain-containing protein [Cystobacterineae bacterium]